MNTISADFPRCFVLHKRYEHHSSQFSTLFCPSSALWRPLWPEFRAVLSFINVMKTISADFSLGFVLHQLYEDHLQQIFVLFCPSSGSWRPFAPDFRAVLSFIQLMKTTLIRFSCSFVLHPPYEDHFDQNFVLFCPSFVLQKSLRTNVILY